MRKTTGYLRLMRPANIVTSVADILAGIAISGLLAEGSFRPGFLTPILLLCVSTIGLYGGGVVFNDVFDADLDRVERPERPIPSGVIRIQEAMVLGLVLLTVGIIAAFAVHYISGIIAVVITAAALIYDKWGKHQSLLGPVNMGLCRGLNLLLGMSIVQGALQQWWWLAIVPVIYIASITMVSRGEVHGGKPVTLYAAAALYSLVWSCICYYSILTNRLLFTLIFLLPFAWMIFSPLFIALQEPIGKNIGRAVKAGVLALILMNAAWAAAFGAYYAAVIIVLLLPLSMKLGKMFAVT